MRTTVGMLRRIIREEVVRSILRENAEPMSPEELKSFTERARETFKNESEKIIGILSNPSFQKAFRKWGSAEFQRSYKGPDVSADHFKEMIRGHQWVLFTKANLASVIKLYAQIKSASEDEQQAIRKEVSQNLNKSGESITKIIKEFETFQKNIEMLDVLPDGALKFEDADAVTEYKNSILDSLQVLADLYEEIGEQLRSIAVNLEDPEYKEQRGREKFENRFRSGRSRIRG